MTTKENIKYFIRKTLFEITGFVLSLIPKKKGLILFTAWFGHKYLDNTKYVYEYFLYNTEYKPIWMTINKKIYNQLRKDGKPVILMNSLRGRWNMIRAEAVFSTVQFSDYNTWFLTNCIYLDLGHGHPIKDPGYVVREGYPQMVSMDILKRVNYYSIVAGTKSKKNYKVVKTAQDHIFVSDFARNDVLFDSSLQKNKNLIVDSFKNGRNAIVYMPTHRSDGKNHMSMYDLLDLESIEKFCKENSFVFIIKKHFYHRNEVENLSNYPHILDITNIDDIDPQVLLCQADILISDYSACYIDYMLLKRPIIFFQYDIEKFKNNERVLYYNFEELNIAPVVYNKEKLVQSIEDIIQNGDRWLDRRMQFARENYFDNINHNGGCMKVKEIFDNLYKRHFN